MARETDPESNVRIGPLRAQFAAGGDEGALLTLAVSERRSENQSRQGPQVDGALDRRVAVLLGAEPRLVGWLTDSVAMDALFSSHPSRPAGWQAIVVDRELSLFVCLPDDQIVSYGRASNGAFARSKFRIRNVRGLFDLKWVDGAL